MPKQWIEFVTCALTVSKKVLAQTGCYLTVNSIVDFELKLVKDLGSTNALLKNATRYLNLVFQSRPRFCFWHGGKHFGKGEFLRKQ